MHLQLSVIHTRALLHSTWDMTFHQTQSFIWKTLTRSKWKADLISSIFQMRKQAYWSKNNLPEVSSWLHTSSSLCSSGPVQSLPQKPQTAYRVIRPALLTWSLEGELEEIREKLWLLYVLHLQPQSHSGFLSWVFLSLVPCSPSARHRLHVLWCGGRPWNETGWTHFSVLAPRPCFLTFLSLKRRAITRAHLVGLCWGWNELTWKQVDGWSLKLCLNIY